MLYIKDNVTPEQLAKYGFKKCKKPYDALYYLCIAYACKVIFIGNGIFIQDWEENDPRIHTRPNCVYRSRKTDIDVIFDLITDGLVEKKEIGE